MSAFMVAGQSKFSIQTVGTTFSPNTLTIVVGDTVVWTNTSGSHNVNGTTSTFPSNPQSFGNSVGSGWVFTHVFTIVGNYDYRCDPHFSFGMSGKITVQNLPTLVTSISVDGLGGDSTITTNGGTLQMIATVLPSNATDTTVTWSVTNGTGSATISGAGLLTASTNGTVTVTATANDSSGVFGDKVITISNQTILVTSISVDGQGGDSTISTLGGSLQMIATVLPSNAKDTSVTWSVTNGSGSATISGTGLLTASTDGTVTVTATANDSSGVFGDKVVTISNQSTSTRIVHSDTRLMCPGSVLEILEIKNVKGNIELLTIIDISGRVLKKHRPLSQTVLINVSELIPGTYFLVIQRKDRAAYAIQFFKN